MGFLAANDTFDNAVPYGARVTGYVRVVPWSSDAVTGFAIPCAAGTLHSGYFSAAAGSQSRQKLVPHPASFTSSSGATAPLVGAAWRAYVGANVIVSAGFSHYLLAGVYNDSFRYVALGARVSGGTVDDTLGAEKITDVDGYWFVLASSGTARWQILRTNAGVITKLAETAAFTITQDMVARSFALFLDVRTVGATVEIKPSVEMVENCTPSQGLGAVNPFGATIVDSSGSRITAAGRAMVLASKERLQSTPTIRTATLVWWFDIFDVGTNKYVHSDDFDRVALEACTATTGELHGSNGRSLMSLWGGDSGSTLGAILLSDAGANRVSANTSTALFAVHQRAASQRTYTHRTVVVNFQSGSVSQRGIGVFFRGTATHDATRRRTYLFELLKDDTSNLLPALYDVSGSTFTPLALHLGLSGFSMNTDITVEVELRNANSESPELGVPAFTCKLNGSTFTWVPFAVGVSIVGTELMDKRESAIRSGVEEGMYVRTYGAAQVVRFDTWTDVQPAGADLGDLSFGAATVSGEQTGQFGAFPILGNQTRPQSSGMFPVRTTRRLPTARHVFVSRHIGRVRLATLQRRRFFVPLENVTDAERDAVLDLHESHKGATLPFQYTDDRGFTRVVSFADPNLARRISAPGVQSLEAELVERLR